MEDSQPTKLSGYTAQILDEVNLLRSDPPAYVAKLHAHEATFIDDLTYIKESEKIKVKTKEGLAAVREAIEFLSTLEPIHPLKYCVELEKAALDHVKDQAYIKNVGHIGTDGTTPSERIRKYGEWTHRIGENIRIRTASAEDIVVAWVISDGKDTRDSRLNILHSDYFYLGAAIGFHDVYGVFSCTVFAHYAGDPIPPAPKVVVPPPAWKVQIDDDPFAASAPPAPKLTPYAIDDSFLKSIALNTSAKTPWETKNLTPPQFEKASKFKTVSVGDLIIPEKDVVAKPPIIHVTKKWEPPPRSQAAPLGSTVTQSYLPMTSTSTTVATPTGGYVTQSYLTQHTTSPKSIPTIPHSYIPKTQPKQDWTKVSFSKKSYVNASENE